MKFYNQLTWLLLTQDEKDAGQTEYKRAVDFETRFFFGGGGKNVLLRRQKLYSLKQKPNQTNQRLTSGFEVLQLSSNVVYEAFRDAFCQDLFLETTKQAVYRAFASVTQKTKQCFLNNADRAAEVEAAQQTSSSFHELAVAASTNKKLKVPTKPAYVNSSGYSRRCR